MPDAFFASTNKKRKRPAQSTGPNKTLRTSKAKGFAQKKIPQPRKVTWRDEELDSNATCSDIDDVDLRASDVDPAESDREDDAHETSAEKRLRLAKIHLESVKEGLSRGEGEFDAAEIDRDIISARLKEDVLENAGKVHIFIAGSLAIEDPPRRLRIKGRGSTVTSAILSHNVERLYVAGKEGGVSSWDVASRKRLSYCPKIRRQKPGSTRGGGSKGKGKAGEADNCGHTDEVLALALSGDGKYLVSGGKDRIIGLWEIRDETRDMEDEKGPRGLLWVKGFGGHKDTISALSFRKSTNILYSASTDRTIKLFDLSPGVLGYVETLFGHQDSIAGLDSLKGDRAVTCGGRDRTCRLWKIADETQLVFRGGGAGKTRVRDIIEGVLDDDDDADLEKAAIAPKVKGKPDRWVEGSVDCIAMLDENTFVSGGDSGTIALWSTTKKKALFSYGVAHGLDDIESSTEGLSHRPRWIMSIACLQYSDLFASGSWDGSIRLWKLDPSLRSFSPVGLLPALGFINSLQLVSMPKGWSRDETWSQAIAPVVSKNGVAPLLNGHTPTPNKVREDEGVLLVAGVGQEPRLGRWIRVKGDGVVNAAVIFSLRRKPN